MKKRSKSSAGGGLSPFDPEKFSIDCDTAARPGAARTTFRALYDGKILAVDAFNPMLAARRDRFAKLIADEAARPAPDGAGVAIPLDKISHALMHVPVAGATPPADTGSGSEYRQVLDADSSASEGIYRVTQGRDIRLTNFGMVIERDVVIQDDMLPARRFEGSIRQGGRSSHFSMSPACYGDNAQFQKAIYEAAGPGVRLLTDVRTIRDAVSATSHEIVEEVRTTAHGWAEGVDPPLYLTTNGRVDAEGFREYGDDEKIRVDLQEEPAAAGLGLKRLSPDRLATVTRHIVEDVVGRLHDQGVVIATLAAVVLAILEPFAGATQRPAIWFRGVTGSGKSYLLSLAMSFFGKFRPGDGGKDSPSWGWTANRIERGGYYFRHALFGVDDFKPELVDVRSAARVVQAYADSHGRGRLQKDAQAARTYAIRGLLASTGEDLPLSNSASLARMVVVTVPDREKDPGVAARCEAFAPDYPGVTADLIAWMIGEGRFKHFAGRYARLKTRLKNGVETRQNSERIASNHALLGAAAYEICKYLGETAELASWEEIYKNFVAVDLTRARDATLDLVRDQQPDEVFLASLASLINTQRVRLSGVCGADSHGPPGNNKVGPNVHLVGKDLRADCGGAIAISISAALGEVNQMLRAEGRPELRITHQALLDLLCASGRLRDPSGGLIAPGSPGPKTFSKRLATGASPTRVALIVREALMPGEESED